MVNYSSKVITYYVLFFSFFPSNYIEKAHISIIILIVFIFEQQMCAKIMKNLIIPHYNFVLLLKINNDF